MRILVASMVCPILSATARPANAPELPSMPNLRLAARLILSIAAVAASAPVLAQGDVEAGKQKAYTCTGCHGIAGYKNVYPHYHVPKIGGQNYEYLVIALTEYRNGNRVHPTMEAQAIGFTDQDIADIAAYLASLTPAK